jgi:hypothetical protein
MTAQIGERLTYDGREVSMCTEPLGDYFAFGGHNPEFEFTCTALWRGYVGTWEIVGDRLYLVGLTGTLKDGAEATLESVFPGYPDRVFAHWYSGTLRIPEGKQLEYVHMGYASTYERDCFLMIEKGVVFGSHVRQNGEADESTGPEGYGIGAMTVFPRSSRDEDGEQ